MEEAAEVCNITWLLIISDRVDSMLKYDLAPEFRTP